MHKVLPKQLKKKQHFRSLCEITQSEHGNPLIFKGEVVMYVQQW